MTPIEKAQDLVSIFKSFSYYDAHDLTSRRRREESNLESAKECALIAVDEILKYQPYDVYSIEVCNHVKLYWDYVKQEIQNI